MRLVCAGLLVLAVGVATVRVAGASLAVVRGSGPVRAEAVERLRAAASAR